MTEVVWHDVSDQFETLSELNCRRISRGGGEFGGQIQLAKNSSIS